MYVVGTRTRAWMGLMVVISNMSIGMEFQGNSQNETREGNNNPPSRSVNERYRFGSDQPMHRSTPPNLLLSLQILPYLRSKNGTGHKAIDMKPNRDSAQPSPSPEKSCRITSGGVPANRIRPTLAAVGADRVAAGGKASTR